MIKYFFFLITAFMVVLLTNAQTASTWAGGTGTKKDPYQISDISHLRLLAEKCNHGMSFNNTYFVLTQDITDNPNILDNHFELITPNTHLNKWTQISCVKDAPFKGNIDGKGHTISGIYNDDHDYDYYSLGSIFGYMEDCEISNLIIADSYFSSLCGQANNCTFNNIITISNVLAAITVSSAGWNNTIENCGNFGPTVFGFSYRDNSKLLNCYNYGVIGQKIPEDHKWGGGGLSDRCSLAVNCMNIGPNHMPSQTSGLVRWMTSSTDCIYNCVNYGSLDAFNDTWSGAIMANQGYNSKEHPIIENCYYLETTCARAYDKFNPAPEIRGEVLKMTEDEMKDPAFLQKLNSQAKAKNKNACGWKRGIYGFPVLEIIDESLIPGYAGIKNISADNSFSEQPIYYNLQGIRVENPHHGIFIKISGDKSTKIKL